MNIIDNTGRVVDTASSLPEANRIIDVMDRYYIAQGPHTIQRETVQPTVRPARRRRFFSRRAS